MEDKYTYAAGQILESMSNEEKIIMESMTVEFINEAYRVSNSNLKAIIKVKGSEGPIPHFHVEYGGKETCFCIYEPLYANHEKWHVPMSEKERIGLNVFLMSPDKNSVSKKKSYWKEICEEWAKKNSDHYYEFKDQTNLQKPNYVKIGGNKSMGDKYKEK